MQGTVYDNDAEDWDYVDLKGMGNNIVHDAVVGFFGEDNMIHVHRRDFETGDWNGMYSPLEPL